MLTSAEESGDIIAIAYISRPDGKYDKVMEASGSDMTVALRKLHDASSKKIRACLPTHWAESQSDIAVNLGGGPLLQDEAASPNPSLPSQVETTIIEDREATPSGKRRTTHAQIIDSKNLTDFLPRSEYPGSASGIERRY